MIIVLLCYCLCLILDYKYKRKAPGALLDYIKSVYAVLLAPLNVAIVSTGLNGPNVFPCKQTHFPRHAVLDTNWQTIRDEALAVVESGAATNIKGDMFFESIADDKWKKLYLKWHGPIDDHARALCPRTCALLDVLPEVRIAMLSVLEPGAVITPHRGPFRGTLRYHLGLSVPKDSRQCYISIDDQKYCWSDGQSVLFDDTYVHSVQNNTREHRVILFCEDAGASNALVTLGRCFRTVHVKSKRRERTGNKK